MIKDITLSIEPSTDVTRNTTVTLRCRATVSSSGQDTLSRQYIIYKDSDPIYTQTSSTSEDLLYHLPKARVSDIGKYWCQINILGKERTSQAKKLTVTGLSKPELHLNKHKVSEGEGVTAWCTAPGETGNLYFYFYEDNKELAEMGLNSSQAETMLQFSSAGIHNIKCSYTVQTRLDSVKSVESNTITVSVTELPVTVVLKIVHQNKTEQNKIYEGDQLDISCTINNSMHNSGNSQLFLTQGEELLKTGSTSISHSKVALAKDQKFECTLDMGNIRKVDTKMVSVTELFSVPILTMSPAEVFQREYMKLTCKSETFASERIRKEELTYSLHPPDSPLYPRVSGEFYGKALLNDFNYTCVAQAKGIVKYSQTLTVRPKVSVSNPRILVVGKVILGQPFMILCQSDIGSLPINYTLLKNYNILNTTTVNLPSERALFTATITKTDEINKFMCEAKNNHKNEQLSRNLYATVIEPLSNLTLTVIPNITEISEGNHLFLICGVRGSPPVTFKWYRKDSEHPLHVTTSNQNNSNYQVASLSKEDSGMYYCEAVNSANTIHSDPVIIEVRLALWKKALIGGACLLLVAVLVLVAVLYFRSKRGRETYSPPASQASYS